jgi:outer membrane protein assembly factor BamE
MPTKASRALPQLLLLATLFLSGCSYFQFPGLHRVEVQQGNIIKDDMVAQLQLGMTKSQVRYIMGTPIIADTFQQDRWDYYYSRKKGSKKGEYKTLTVFFINGKLSKIGGDYDPDAVSEKE